MSAQSVDVLAALTAIEHQMRQRGGSPSCQNIADARDAVSELIDTLQYCANWFAKHSPTAELITGAVAEHPMLTCIRTALARVGGDK